MGNHYVRTSSVKNSKTNRLWHFFFAKCKEENLVVIVSEQRICNHNSFRDITILKYWLTFNSYNIAKIEHFRASSVNNSKTDRPWNFSSTWDTGVYLFVILCKRQVCNFNRFRIIDVEKNLLSSCSDNPAHNIWRALDTLIPLPPMCQCWSGGYWHSAEQLPVTQHWLWGDGGTCSPGCFHISTFLENLGGAPIYYGRDCLSSSWVNFLNRQYLWNYRG